MNNPPEDERVSRDDAFLADLFTRAEEELIPAHPHYDPDEGMERFLEQLGNSQSAVPPRPSREVSARLPDPQRSYAVLIGTGTYADDRLPDLPAVGRTISDLAAALTDPVHGILSEDHCTVLEDQEDISLIERHLQSAASQAEDLLLVHFTGHGLVGGRHELYFGMPDSQWAEPEFNSLEYDKLRSSVLRSAATTKILILDCCFTGRAVSKAMTGPVTEIEMVDQIEADGTYVLASAERDYAALALPGEQHTAFTGRLLHILRNGVPGGPEFLTVDDLYQQLLIKLNAGGLSRPHKRGTTTAGLLALTRNQAFAAAQSPARAGQEAATRHERTSADVRGAIDIAAVDDHPIILDSVAGWVMADEDDMRVIATVATVEALLAGPGRHAHVVLLDLDLGDGTAVERNVADILAAGPAVLVLSASERPRAIRDAIRAGALGYLLKNEQTDRIRAAIREVAAGRAWISPRLAYILATDDAPDRPALSPNELHALRLYATGMPMKSIARNMAISDETVKQYLGRVRHKYARAGRPAPTGLELHHRAVEDRVLPPPRR
jgi:DNA-binding NarL/FixJ family response regulator